jgi:hypothetical protein
MPSVPSSWAGRAAQLAALTILCRSFRALSLAVDSGEMADAGTQTILNPGSALDCLTIWREIMMMAPANVPSASITSNAAPWTAAALTGLSTARAAVAALGLAGCFGLQGQRAWRGARAPEGAAEIKRKAVLVDGLSLGGNVKRGTCVVRAAVIQRKCRGEG